MQVTRISAFQRGRKDAGQISQELETALGNRARLMARNPGDTVHGAVTTFGSEVIVELYEGNDAPKPGRPSTLAKHSLTPADINLIKATVEA